MRPRFLLPPSPEMWQRLQIHELARDYPELLPLLRERGILGGANGTKTLRDLDGISAEALTAAVAWRA